MYTVGGFVMADPNYLAHHGIKGQKWGVRRFQNPDMTWTELGKKRYGKDDYHRGDVAERALMNRANREQKRAYKFMAKSEKATNKAKMAKAERYKQRADMASRNAKESAKDVERYRSASAEDQKKMRRQARLAKFGAVTGGIAGKAITKSASKKLQNMLGKYGGQDAATARAMGRDILAKPKMKAITAFHVASIAAMVPTAIVSGGLAAGVLHIRHSDETEEVES